MVTLENDFERIALGGLLHDIGKLFNRSDLYKKKGEGGEHPFLSAWFVEYLVKNELIKEDKILKELIQKHHESKYFPKELNVSSLDGEIKKLALIVAKADNYSSMERDGAEKRRPYRSVPLDSIFSRIDIGKGSAPTTRYYLREWKKEELFSKHHEENSQDEINKIIEKFLNEIKEIKCVEFKTFYMRVLELIKKYTWALPSDTQKEICDLSLYDHLKTTSAIATASYNYHMEEKGSLERITQASINDGKNQKHFLLVAGDVSGIQKYIYSLVNSKNIAKRLRARSFFIKILTEIASIKIIKELNLTISNIVISNGGKFYIIAQNSEVTRKKLKEIKNQINKELYDEYEGEIFLNLKGTELTGEELGIKFSEKFDKINDLLEKGKNKKFHKEILENPVINDSLYGSGEKVDLCPICGKYLKAKNKDSCQKCKRDEYWGTNLPTMENIAIYEGETSEADRISLFGFNAKILKENETVEGVPYLVINFGKSSGIEDLYPTCTENYGGYIPTKDGEVMSFNEIAQESKSRNLGILKGDIDDLGMIFSMGLKMEDEDEEQKKIKDVTSISRVATLSRMIDVFFSNWIPKVLKEKQEELGSHYVVYAGGDDFMIVGAWDKLLDVAKLIQEEFQRFVGKNPNFTISMGLAITKERDPIYLSSKWATELEGVAKSSGKNGIAIFDTYIPWGRYKEVFEFGEFLIKLREKYGISQSFIYRLLDYTSRAEKYQETKNSKYLSYLSHFEYDMARNIYSKLENKKDGGEVKSKLLKYFGYKGFIDKKDMEFLCSYMRVAINYAVRKVREV